MTELERVIVKIVDMTLEGYDFHIDSNEERGYLHAQHPTKVQSYMLFEWENFDFPGGEDDLTMSKVINGIIELWPVRTWTYSDETEPRDPTDWL